MKSSVKIIGKVNRKKTEEEIRLIQLIKEGKRLLQKAERQGKIKFYREALQDWGYEVYFWDTVKKRQKDGRKGYRVCFAYKTHEQEDCKSLYAYAVFCHPGDNFDRLEAWKRLYEDINDGVSGFGLIVKDLKKTSICDELRKAVVHRRLSKRPTLFKKHCKTWLKDV